VRVLNNSTHNQTPTPHTAKPGYFGLNDASSHSWRGAIAAGQDLSHYPPDCGPLTAHPSRGVVTIGAAPWIINFNVPIATDDMSACRRVARAISERGGGLQSVEVCTRVGGGGGRCFAGVVVRFF